MKHGATCPRMCSQCAEARGDSVTVRRIDQAAGLIKIDGVPARPIDVETLTARSRYGKRGGAASSRITRRKT